MGRTRWREWVKTLLMVGKKEGRTALRFAAGDGRQTGGKAWCSHVCVRIETLKMIPDETVKITPVCCVTSV